jgi:hypothetical protein
VDRALQQVAIEMGRGESFNKAPVGVYFGSLGSEAEARGYLDVLAGYLSVRGSSSGEAGVAATGS